MEANRNTSETECIEGGRRLGAVPILTRCCCICTKEFLGDRENAKRICVHVLGSFIIHEIRLQVRTHAYHSCMCLREVQVSSSDEECLLVQAMNKLICFADLTTTNEVIALIKYRTDIKNILKIEKN